VDLAAVLSSRISQAVQIQAPITIADKARAAVVAALNDVKRDAGKR